MQFLTLALNLIPILEKIGTALPDIISFGEWAFATAKKDGGPTADDWNTLHQKEDAARAVLRASALAA